MAIWRNTLELMLNPFFLGVVLLIFCIGLLVQSQSRSLVRKLLMLVVGLFIVIGTGWIPNYLTHYLEKQFPVIKEIDPTIHWVVVLSGGQAQVSGMPENALMSSASIKRLVEGVRLFRLLPNATLLLSGGGYLNEESEAYHLSELAQWFAIPKQNIVIETRSINTFDQIDAIRSIVKQRPFYLVTSAIHMPRAMSLCHELGLNPIAAPTDFTLFWNDERLGKMIIPNSYNMMYFTVALHELLGRVWRALLLRMS